MDVLIHWYNSYKIISDVVTGLISSGIFLIILSLLKPNIEISDKISFIYTRPGTGRNAPNPPKYRYYFKIVNNSILFRIYDIQVRAWSTETRPSQNSDDTYFKEIELVKNYQWVVNRLMPLHLFQKVFNGERRLKYRTDYAAQFNTCDNLKQMIDNGRSITIEIIAKHSLTGFTRVKYQTYKHSGDIIKGSFLSGNTCKIK
ncbi:hypothetical protein [Pedobacter sp.]|uniref:hypothetical protein n=1 Tax=Pedobacter sp. TaxID=1411316 RepID=UPI003D7F2CE3